MPAMHGRFLATSADCLGDFRRRIEACVGRLSDEQIWWRPNPAVNSVANLLLHLRGNVSQWVLAGLGGAAYERHRTQEFTASRTEPAAALLAALSTTVLEAQRVIRGLSPEEMARPRRIQGYDVDGVYVVVHVVEHFSYHTGQIVHVTKELLGPAAQIDFFPQHRGE
jgi:uncharacterized damage-inducible protein DinB